MSFLNSVNVRALKDLITGHLAKRETEHGCCLLLVRCTPIPPKVPLLPVARCKLRLVPRSTTPEACAHGQYPHEPQ